MKKNLAARLGVLALVLTLVTSSLVSGTYSKYVSTSTGSDTARVAKFAFNLTDGTNNIPTATLTGSYNLFNYTDGGVYNNGYNAATTANKNSSRFGKFIKIIFRNCLKLSVN